MGVRWQVVRFNGLAGCLIVIPKDEVDISKHYTSYTDDHYEPASINSNNFQKTICFLLFTL